MRVREIYNNGDINEGNRRKEYSDLDKRKLDHNPLLDRNEKKLDNSEENDKKIDYSRPTHWRSGMRDAVWENAKNEHGRVRDPVSGKFMSKDKPWHMGHKPGYEFRKHQDSAERRGISREKFLDEYYNSDHFRPELPESNMSHKGEDTSDRYLGD